MLSNKWTFSLTSLVVILALVFVVPSAMAAEFAMTLGVGTDVDISGAGDIQVVYGNTGTTDIKVDTGAVVQVVTPGTFTDTAAAHTTAIGVTTLELDDFQVIAYNSFGGIVVNAPDLTGLAPVPTADGKSFMMNLVAVPAPGAAILAATDITKVLIFIPKHAVEVADPRANLDATTGLRTLDGKSAEASITINYVRAEPTEEAGDPTVYSIRRASDPLLPVTAATENVIILLSEQPKEFTKDHVDVTNATWVDPVALVAIPEDANGPDNTADNADDMLSTGRDNKLYPYVLTITPKYVNKNDIVVKVKAFEDMVLPVANANKYTVPAREADYVEGRSKLTIKVGKEAPVAKSAGFKLALPEKKVIPGSGYLVVAEDKAGSSVHVPPGAIDAAPKLHERTPAELIYNVIDDGDLPNLETFLANGGVIDVMSPHALVISEVMWGSDASIESMTILRVNGLSCIMRGAVYTTVAEDAATDAYEATYLVFYGPNETPPAMTAAVAATATSGGGARCIASGCYRPDRARLMR